MLLPPIFLPIGWAWAVERAVILELRNQDVINDEVLRRIQRDIDLAEARL